MSKVMLIEDDPEIREVIEIFFTARDMRVVGLPSGTGAAEVLEKEEPDIVLLDIMLPGVDGFTVCRQLRRASDIPIVFLTARAREEDVLFGYELGADDYIIKPFSLPALYAKVCALLRRCSELGGKTVTCGRITLDPRALRVWSDGREIELPPKEFLILKCLMDHKDWVIDRQTMLDKVWGMDYFGSDRVVDNHIRNLRKALGEPGKQIKTVFSRGYKLTDK